MGNVDRNSRSLDQSVWNRGGVGDGGAAPRARARSGTADTWALALATVLSWGVAVLLVALHGCAGRPPELPGAERRAVHAALEGWRLAGLPAPTSERCDFTRVIVRRARTGHEFEQRCFAASSARNAACLTWESSGHWFRPRSYPVVNLDYDVPPVDVQGEPIIHELMHAQYHCAGMPFWAPENTDHRNPHVWSAAGGMISAQSKARELYAGGGM